MPKYLVDYDYNGAKWAIQLDADSVFDAQRRLKAIANGTVLGQLEFYAPLPVRKPWYRKLMDDLKNLRRTDLN